MFVLRWSLAMTALMLAVSTPRIGHASSPPPSSGAGATTAAGKVEFSRQAVRGDEPVAGACDGCEAVFQGLPARVDSRARLAPPDEPGEALTLSGTVYDGSGKAATDIIVYAYQTDRDGRYPRDDALSGAAARHGRLRAWVRTGADGRYRFLGIRPGAYPDDGEPQHIHMHVLEPGRCTYYLGDVMFGDDPRLSTSRRRAQERAPGGSGVVEPRGDALAGWHAERDIHLGRHVENYTQSCRPRR